VDAILTHENADFDAVASLIAAKKIYPEATALLPRRVNRNVRDFLILYGEAFALTQQDQAPRRRFKRVLLVDTQNLPSARGLAESPQVHILDHHPLTRSLDGGGSYIGGETGATTTLLVETVREKNLTLSPVEATLFTLGIYEDTGSLSYPDTTPRDVGAAAFLLERGAMLTLVSEFLHHPLSDGQRALYNQLLQNAQIHECAGHIIVIAAARAKEYVEEISTLAHQMMTLYDPSALFLLVQMGDQIQMVARSKHRAIDAAAITREFGGGGHATAAAALIRERGLKKQVNQLLKLLRERVQPMFTVQQIMSYGVRVLEPATSMAEAAEMARRWGHEGFPVANKKKLVGVLTRREIDRALHHKLQNQPVRRFMSSPASVSPLDSIERLQKVMTEHALGQVPVVEDGRILGIVTRTDLLKLYTEPARPSRREEMAARLERALPKDLLRLLKEASHTTRELGYSLYLVGGFVRDLLIGQANLDLDLVVEGDAPALAQRLAEKYGGRVHTHARFGTAKWMTGRVKVGAGSTRPNNLDFATARTEFYEYPSALPEVERSSIKMDLHRRDFTVNAMAICLDPDRYGELLDPYGGEQDLQRGWIRVLHNLSFVEDPTRILRAVRFEQRFGFKIEPRTAQLIDDAREMLERVSADRLRHELNLIFAEAAPENALARLQELGALEKIQPNLKADAWLANKFRALRESLTPTPLLYLGLLTYRLKAAEAKQSARRLRLPKHDTDVMQQIVGLRLLERQLSMPNISPSRVVELVEEFDDAALAVFAIATDSERARANVDQFRGKWRAVQPALTGADLRMMGLPPGPAYRQILAQLRAKRLDGEITTRAEEEARVRQWVAEGGKTNGR
jgi:tRNA nucleotidyltransferase (CCA-adding enzyme)